MSSPDTACVASWCADDEWCSVACTAHLVGRKWHPVIVDRLLTCGPMGFNALERELDSISSTVLSNSLEDLQAKGLVDRAIVSETPFRVEYSLTERGESLEPVIEAMADWGDAHLEESGGCT